MKKIKSLVALSLALCMVLCFAGCSSNNDEGSLKDNLVNGFNNWLESFSKHAVTKDKNLQGERKKDIDEYTGWLLYTSPITIERGVRISWDTPAIQFALAVSFFLS